MKPLPTLLAAFLATVALNGCAYKPLKAPCAPDEGISPLGYADTTTATAHPPLSLPDHCGPMRPI